MISNNEPGTTTAPGLHDFLFDSVLPKYLTQGEKILDLGAGPGSLTTRLLRAGWDVTAADTVLPEQSIGALFVHSDFNRENFARELGPGRFGLVISVEVIEHVESPIGFLRNIRCLLHPGGVAVITTPNVDNTPARIKFLLRGTIRMMDAKSEKTHISPIFWDLFTRQFLPRSGMRLLDHYLYPQRDYQMTRRLYAIPICVLSKFLGGECPYGDNHVIVLARETDPHPSRTP